MIPMPKLEVSARGNTCGCCGGSVEKKEIKNNYIVVLNPNDLQFEAVKPSLFSSPPKEKRRQQNKTTKEILLRTLREQCQLTQSDLEELSKQLPPLEKKLSYQQFQTAKDWATTRAMERSMEHSRRLSFTIPGPMVRSLDQLGERTSSTETSRSPVQPPSGNEPTA